MRLPASLLFAALSAIALALPYTSLAETCTPPMVPITDDMRAAATMAGIPATINCWNPNDPLIGSQAGGVKVWLQQHATQNSNISCLNTDFASKLKTLMEAVPGGVPNITDGYRSPQRQASLPAGTTNAGPCQSYHQYGQAADFNNSSQQTLYWMRSHAAQYGLAPVSPCAIPTGSTCSGSLVDPGHIQIAGSHAPPDQCGICSNTAGQGALPAPATVTPSPDDIPGGELSCPNGYALFNGQCVFTQQPLQCPPGYLIMYGQCVPFQQNQSQYPYQNPPRQNTPTNPIPPSNTGSQPPIPQSPLNTALMATTSLQPTFTNSTNTSSLPSFENNAAQDILNQLNGSSTSDRASSLIKHFTTTIFSATTGTPTTSAILNPELILENLRATMAPNAPSAGTTPLTTAVSPPLSSTQTLTSTFSDAGSGSILSGSITEYGTPMPRTNTLGDILNSMKTYLFEILNYLHLL